MADKKAAKKTETVNEDAPVTAAAATIQTKVGAMTGILAAMATLSNEQMMQWFPDAMQLAADIANDDAAKNAASIAMKPSAAVGAAVHESVAALFEGEELSEDAQSKIGTLIEHAVDLRVAIEREQLEEDYRVKLIEESAKIQDELVEKIDSYATYAAEQWVEKNEVAVESAVKVERAERLMEGLADLFVKCGVTVPEDKTDAFESLTAQVADLQAKLNEAVEDCVSLAEDVKGKSALLLFKEVAEGLTPMEAEKFKKLVEDVEIDSDMTALRAKLTVIKEAHFKGDRSKATTGLTEEVVLTESELKEEQTKKLEEAKSSAAVKDPRIAAYADAITKASGNRYARGPYTG